MIYLAARLRKLARVGSIVICIVGRVSILARAEPIKPFARKDSLPIVDVHGHLNGDMSAEQLIDLMDKSGVSRMVLMPRYFGGRHSGGAGSDEQASQYAKTYPGRFIPFVAGQRDMLDDRDRWLNPDRQAENLLQEMETELRTQQFFGIGELIIRHYAFEGRQRGIERDIPVNTPLMGRFAELAARYEVPLLIHAEGEPDVVAGMKQVLEKNPKTRIIWAHNCGRSSPDIIRSMLVDHANLSCDLGGMLNAPFSPYGRYWPKRTPWMFLIEDGNGNLLPEMKALYEALPNRFYLGTDPAFTRALGTYTRRIERFRELLSGLTPEAARRLGYQNADELFRKLAKE